MGLAGLGTLNKSQPQHTDPSRRTGTSARSLPHQKPIGRCGRRGKAEANILMYDVVQLVVSTHLKDTSQTGNFPQIGVKIEYV